jgi:hypothetical protein
MGMVEKHNIKIKTDLRGTLVTITGVPTTITPYTHGFSAVPSFVFITMIDGGTTGIVREIKASRNSSSISLQANISGVGVDVLVVP